MIHQTWQSKLTDDAASRGPGLAYLPDLAVTRFDGADAATFLQGYFTCDTADLAPGVLTPTALCSLKGRVVLDGWCTPGADGDRIVLVLHRSLAGRLAEFLEVDYEIGVLVGMAIVFIYAVLGGMKGITYTQIAQYCVLIFAYTVPAVFISLQLTGTPVPQLGLGSELVNNGTYMLDKLDAIITDLGFAAYTEQKGSTLNLSLLTSWTLECVQDVSMTRPGWKSHVWTHLESVMSIPERP